jgi:OPA family glycerol-3-phosphate transporter-like MFS transporter 1/2
MITTNVSPARKNQAGRQNIGGIIGEILARFMSDQLDARATTAALLMYLAIPSLYAFHAYGSISKVTNITLVTNCNFC